MIKQTQTICRQQPTNSDQKITIKKIFLIHLVRKTNDTFQKFPNMINYVPGIKKVLLF